MGGHGAVSLVLVLANDVGRLRLWFRVRLWFWFWLWLWGHFTAVGFTAVTPTGERAYGFAFECVLTILIVKAVGALEQAAGELILTVALKVVPDPAPASEVVAVIHLVFLR
jgi:hypothetical protein